MEYLCNLLIPGAAKSGTTSLCALLDQHPDICLATPKEPQFFTVDDRYAGGAEAHNALFGGASARYYADGSQSYFVRDSDIDRISQALTAPKVILILRDPIGRLLSQYAWNFRRATETARLEDALAERGWSTDYVYDERLHGYREVGGYLSFSKYSRFVPQWRERFGAENVLVLSFEDFAQRQEAVLHRCFEFLGLPPVDHIQAARENTTEKTRTKVVPGGLKAVGRLVPGFIKGGLYQAARERMLTRATPKPDTRLSPQLRAWLEAEFADDIAFHRAVEAV